MVSAVEDASKNLRVEGFYTSAKNGRVTGEFFYWNHLRSLGFNKFLGAARGIDGHTLLLEQSDNGFQVILVINGDEGRLNFFECHGREMG